MQTSIRWADLLQNRFTNYIRHVLNSAYAPAAITLIAVLIPAIYLEHTNRIENRIKLHQTTSVTVGAIGTRLQREIETNLESLRLVSRTLSLGTAQEDDDFRKAALLAFEKPNALTQLTLVTENGNNISLTRNNAPVIAIPGISQFMAFKAMQGGIMNTTEPLFSYQVSLREGRAGFFVRYPLFRMIDGRNSQAGYMFGVIDRATLFKDARFESIQDGIAYALQVQTSYFAVNKVFYGEADIFRSDVAFTSIDLPSGKWALSAAPVGGWDTEPDNTWSLRLLMFLAGLLVFVPVVLAGRLFRERQQKSAALLEREAELDITRKRLMLALDASKTGIWEIVPAARMQYWDPRMCALHGAPEGSTESSSALWRRVCNPADLQLVSDAVRTTIMTGSEFNVQYSIVLDDGQKRVMRAIGSLELTNDGLVAIAGICRDVTEDVALTEDLRRAKELADAKNADLQIAMQDLSESRRDQLGTAHRLHVALMAFDCGVWEAHPGEGSIWDERMHSLYGIPYVDGRVSFETWQNTLHPDDRESAMKEYGVEDWPDGNRIRDRRVMLEGGKIRYVRSHGTCITGDDGEVHMTGVAFDITRDMLLTEQLKNAKDSAEQRAEEIAVVKDRILHNSRHDSLTGLANRRYLDEELERLSKERRKSSDQIAIMHLDLDRFKQINDTMGHAAGDAMLVHASQILKNQCRKTDLVARIGGDEFVVLVTDRNSEQGLARLAGRIIEQMRLPIIHQGHECRFGVSIGIAQERLSRDDARQLLVNADIALYRAKEKGRNRYEFFTDDLAAEIINTKRTADEILSGLENNEFVPWYQPQFDCDTQRLSGLEALVRWNHPTKGVLTPDKFMKTAEELNAVSALDRIVLEKSMSDRMTWAAQGLIIPKISVNVSARRLQDESLIESLKDLHIVPGQISFELIESIFLDDNDTMMTTNIERIKSLGIDIEIDDFGTGYTSIVSLLKLKPKRLKIDRQLVSPILDSREERSMVKSIIEIGRSLNIETVAEGVETREHGEMLKFLGCNYLQGFALGRPMPASAMVEFCKTEPWRKQA
jgi:diguanylate cyclase (GGDEF)-like protein